MVSTGSFTHQLWELKLYADKQFILDVEKYTILLKDHMRDAMLKKHNKRFEFKPHEHLLNHKRFATWKEYREYYNIDKLSRIFLKSVEIWKFLIQTNITTSVNMTLKTIRN